MRVFQLLFLAFILVAGAQAQETRLFDSEVVRTEIVYDAGTAVINDGDPRELATIRVTPQSDTEVFIEFSFVWSQQYNGSGIDTNPGIRVPTVATLDVRDVNSGQTRAIANASQAFFFPNLPGGHTITYPVAMTAHDDSGFSGTREYFLRVEGNSAANQFPYEVADIYVRYVERR